MHILLPFAMTLGAEMITFDRGFLHYQHPVWLFSSWNVHPQRKR